MASMIAAAAIPGCLTPAPKEAQQKTAPRVLLFSYRRQENPKRARERIDTPDSHRRRVYLVKDIDQ